MSSTPFVLKNVKQKMTRHLNILGSLLEEAEDYREPWQFPSDISNLQIFLTSNTIILKNLLSKIEQQRETINNFYNECNYTISQLQEDKTDIEEQFDQYWEDKKGESLLLRAQEVERKLEKRLVELECQEVCSRQQLFDPDNDSRLQRRNNDVNQEQRATATNSWTVERRLLGNELKIPTFTGNPVEFGPFWELFEELVHKQPYSNIEKLSILLNCCKGDASRTLQMIPRTGEAYGRAIAQLKNQYEDPRRIKMHMIHQLKTMRQCKQDPRSLRNNLSDIQAIVATLEKEGETVDTTNMINMVLGTFSQAIQEEMAKKEFDSGKTWTTKDLLDNLTMAVRQREHINSFKQACEEEHSIFHTSTSKKNLIRCTGCEGHHKFQYCDKFPLITQKIQRLKSLNACWKCFSRNHSTPLCRKQNCPSCGGPYNLILCKRRPRPGHQQNMHGQAYNNRKNSARHSSHYDQKRRYHFPNSVIRSRSHSPNKSKYASQDSNQTNRYRLRSPEDNLSGRSNNSSSERNHSRSSRDPQTARVRFQRTPSPLRERSSNHVSVNLQIQEMHANGEVLDEFNTHFIKKEEVRLMIVPLYLKPANEEDRELAFAILDSASDQSFISNCLVQRMKFTVQNEATIVVNTFGGKAEKKRVRKVTAPLYNPHGNCITLQLLTSDKITAALELQNINPRDMQFIETHFSKDEARWISQVNGIILPELLIGIDYFNAIMTPNEPVARLPSGLFVTPTFFGPVISGVTNDDANEPDIKSYVVHLSSSQSPRHHNLDISDLWKLPSVGIEDLSTEEELNKQIVEDFYSSVQVRDGKIFVKFPWKPNKTELANNYSLALSRLHQLLKMKDRNPQCWKEYCAIIDDQLKKGFVEDAPQIAQGCLCYYIPHQAVIKAESPTTKTRIVLDASSKMKGKLSLNDVIHQGPLILPNLCGILIRSRIGSKIMIADVEKAFHMIHLQEQERDTVRFLWLKDVSKPATQENIRILRFCRLPFGIDASPFLLAISIKYGLENQDVPDDTLREQLNSNLYVDNVLVTGASTESLFEKYQLCKQIFNKMSMNLRQFLANDQTFNKTIATEDLSTSKSTKILGIPWDHVKDTLTITCKLRSHSKPLETESIAVNLFNI